MDFALLPPEVNSGRMYAGPGPAPMLAASAAWDTLAAELHSMAAGYESAVATLTAGWQGASAAGMASAAAPYTAWLHATAEQAELAATQGRAAAAAYEAAFAATVPPPTVAANRSLLLALIATNLLGQNTPAIAATEAHYSEMWAQDVAAMCGYAGAAAFAAQLVPFTDPPQTVGRIESADELTAAPRAAGRLAGSNAQGQLSKLMSALPNSLQNLTSTVPSQAAASSTPGIHDGLQSIIGALNIAFGPYSPLGYAGVAGGWFLTGSGVLSTSQNVPGVAALLSAPKPITGVLAPLAGQLTAAPTLSPAGLGGGTVSAAAARAGLVGNLSVPPTWTAAAPAAKTVAAVLPSTDAGGTAAITADNPAGLVGGTAALSSLAGRALDAAGARTIAGGAPRTIGTAAACVGSLATEGVDTTVTIVVIPPPGR